jgi:hypothetical protein
LDPEKKGNPTLKVLESSEIARPGGPPVPLVSYTTRGKDGTTLYMVRGFVATGSACGDLEVYSSKPMNAQEADIAAIFSSYLFDENYSPKSSDVFSFAQTLFQAQKFNAAAPMFELALAKLTDDPAAWPSVKTARRVIMVSGEPMPDPTKDDSFLPYQQNKDFWTFLQNLQATR